MKQYDHKGKRLIELENKKKIAEHPQNVGALLCWKGEGKRKTDGATIDRMIAQVNSKIGPEEK